MTGQQIKALRERLGMSQETFAWQLGLATKGAVSRLESGTRTPTGPVLLLLQMLAEKAKNSREKGRQWQLSVPAGSPSG